MSSATTRLHRVPHWACICVQLHDPMQTHNRLWVGLLFFFQRNSAYPILFLRNALFLTLIMWFGWKWMCCYGSHHLGLHRWSQMGTWSALGQLEHFPDFQNLGWEKVRCNASSCWWPCFLSCMRGSLYEKMKHICREKQRGYKEKVFWYLKGLWFHCPWNHVPPDFFVRHVG